MVSLLMAFALTSATSGPQVEQGYNAAYQQSVAQGKPLMVVVGAPWCPACNVLKDSTIKPLAESGELDGVSLAIINRDDDPELAKKLCKGDRMLPQIIVFSKEENGSWKRRNLRGYQPRQPVRSLVRRALGRG